MQSFFARREAALAAQQADFDAALARVNTAAPAAGPVGLAIGSHAAANFLFAPFSPLAGIERHELSLAETTREDVSYSDDSF